MDNNGMVDDNYSLIKLRELLQGIDREDDREIAIYVMGQIVHSVILNVKQTNEKATKLSHGYLTKLLVNQINETCAIPVIEIQHVVKNIHSISTSPFGVKSYTKLSEIGLSIIPLSDNAILRYINRIKENDTKLIVDLLCIFIDVSKKFKETLCI